VATLEVQPIETRFARSARSGPVGIMPADLNVVVCKFTDLARHVLKSDLQIEMCAHIDVIHTKRFFFQCSPES
jgi:hypothetical protein